MKDGRTFYIEMEGYDQQPELNILIGVDIFVDERGRILAEIPNKNIRIAQQNREKNENRAELEVSITKSEINENKEFDFTIIAKNNGKEDAEETKVKMKLPNGYRFIKAEGFPSDEKLIEWKETDFWKIGMLEANEEKKLIIKVQILEDATIPKNYTFLAEISSQTQEATFENNNMKIGNRIFVIKIKDDALIDTNAPFAGLTRKEYRETKSFFRENANNYEKFTPDCIAYKNCVEIIADKFTRNEMARIIEQDCREKPENNNVEFGGVVYKDGRVEESSEKDRGRDPSKDNTIGIVLTEVKGEIVTNFHSHPSRGIFNQDPHNQTNNDNTWANAPSDQIVDNATGKTRGDLYAIRNEGGNYKEVVRYVFARRINLVYMYNINGVLATLPLDKFKNL